MSQERNAREQILLLRTALRALMNAAVTAVESGEPDHRRFVRLEVAADEAQTALDETEGEVRV